MIAVVGSIMMIGAILFFWFAIIGTLLLSWLSDIVNKLLVMLAAVLSISLALPSAKSWHC